MVPNSKNPVFYAGGVTIHDIDDGSAGLNKREFIATFLYSKMIDRELVESDLKSTARKAVHAADLLLKELGQPK